MAASDGTDKHLHGQVFAQVLGVEENEEFATEITYSAADFATNPFTGWIVEDLIDKKRQDLLANAVDTPSPALSPVPTPMATVRSFVHESSINSTDLMALIEAMFAGAVGISLVEEFASELGVFAVLTIQEAEVIHCRCGGEDCRGGPKLKKLGEMKRDC
eukprot:gene17710-20176_t